MSVGFFITLEGPEGCGKTTQARLLNDYLKQKGLDVIWTFEPGGTSTGEKIREILLHSSGKMDSLTELFLFEADRAQHVRELLIPALTSGKILICDRYIDSTTAYQGYGRGMNLQIIQSLNLLATSGLYPDRTFLLDLDPRIGMARRLTKGKAKVNPSSAVSKIEDADRIEQEALQFHQRVRDGFLELAGESSNRTLVVSADQTIEDIFKDIKTEVDSLLANAKETEEERMATLTKIQENLASGNPFEQF